MTWTVAPNPLDSYASRACWAADRDEFIAVGADLAASKAILRSSNGIAWTYEASPFDGGAGYAVIRIDVLGLYIAVGTAAGAALIATSPDGVTWTARGNPFPGSATSAYGLARKPSTGAVIVGGQGGDQNIATSADGNTYTPVSSPFDGSNAQVPGIDYSPGEDRWIAGGTDNSSVAAAAYSDDDGATWTPIVVPMQFISDVYRDEANGNWYLLGQCTGGAGHVIAVSSDSGATWTTIATPLDGGASYGMVNAGGPLALTGGDASSSNQLAVSTDLGVTWAYDATASIFGTSGGYGQGLAYSASLDRALVLGYGSGTIAYGHPSPLLPPELTIRIYDLGVNVLADISAIALEKSLARITNGPRGYTVQAPANSPLLTALWEDGDGLPILGDGGNRKLVVWEDADPDTEDPIFHGRITGCERDGTENELLVTITAFDPRVDSVTRATGRPGGSCAMAPRRRSATRPS